MKYTSKNFQIHYLPSYTLLVKTDFINDTLIVLNKQREVQVLSIYPANEPDADAMKLLGLPFQDVHVMLPTQSLVFVPTEVYRTDMQEHYQEFLLDDNSERTYTYAIHNMNITACYQYDMLLYNRWRNIFPNAHFFTGFQSVLEKIQAYVPLQGVVLGTHFSDVQLDLYAFVNGQFKVYQTFDISNSDDLNYFVLILCQTLSIPIPVQKILVSGLPANHGYIENLKRLASQVEFIATPHSWKTENDEIAGHLKSFQAILDFDICEL